MARATDQHWPLLVIAAYFGWGEGVSALLAAEADPDKADDDGATPAWIAAQKGDAGCLQLLLAAVSDLSGR